MTDEPHGHGGTRGLRAPAAGAAPDAVRGVLRRYASLLPVTPATPALTLGEGGTPLLAAPRLAEWVGVSELFLKFEGVNPTGSFKDRGMVVAVAKAVEEGRTTVLCASTGNTAASAAAYAARAGLTAVVLLPRGKVAAGKLAQAVAYGARVVALDANFDVALDVARELAERYPVALVNSVNPYRIEGQATAAYEICDALGDAPDLLALPVGNGGNISAYWLGFKRYVERGSSERLPRVLGAQAEGAAPLVRGEPVAEPETVATAIRIGRPASWDTAVAAVRESAGSFRAVSDAQILDAYREIARREGVFCEPASAAGVAALRLAVRDGAVNGGSRCVCVLTGHGLKDPDTALGLPFRAAELPADVRAVAAELGWE
ncbi:MAG TPA: threonine synthase [Longimicrobiales bacterium]